MLQIINRNASHTAMCMKQPGPLGKARILVRQARGGLKFCSCPKLPSDIVAAGPGALLGVQGPRGPS